MELPEDTMQSMENYQQLAEMFRYAATASQNEERQRWMLLYKHTNSICEQIGDLYVAWSEMEEAIFD